MRIALKVFVSDKCSLPVDVNTLLKMLAQYEINATFFVSPPKRSRWNPLSANEKVFQAVVESLLQQGHEVGAAPMDAAVWKERILDMDRLETEREVARAIKIFRDIGCSETIPWSSSGNRINADVPLIQQRFDIRYASDTRGLTPFFPVTVAGRSSCVQIPTTLPLISELIGQGIAPDEIHQYLFMESQKPLNAGHVFVFELDGSDVRLPLEVLEKIVVMWKGAHWEFSTLGEMYQRLDLNEVAEHEIGLHAVKGAADVMAVQGPRVIEPTEE